MKVLVLGGAGDIGSAIGEILCSLNVDEVVLGDVNQAKAEEVSKTLRSKGYEVYASKVDALKIDSLREASKGVDVVVNAVGPFYKYGFNITKNLIDADLNFVDVCDDYDAAEKILGLNELAVKKKLSGITGLGWTPGLSNILALEASRRIGELDYVHIYWVGSAADSRGLAVVMHLFHALIGRVPMYLGGEYAYVDAGSGGVNVEFPKPIGAIKLYYTGHPEPITIPRFIKVKNDVTVHGGLIPSWQNGFAKFLLKILKIDSDAKIENLSRWIHRIEDIFRAGGLQLSAVRVDAEGKDRKISFISMDRMRKLTGLPAALGAVKLSRGELDFIGVKPPEAVIRDSKLFIDELSKHGISINCSEFSLS
jgi:saccharopine dehydrogenase-like NADP-dependent oxidoreductase